jgi:heptosyltransferase I
MAFLFVKMSSLGDVVHHFPALTDACAAFPATSMDWVVEEAYAPLVAAHPGVRRVIPVSLRRLAKRWRDADARRVWRAMQDSLAMQHYDAIIDTQGLLKSAWVARQAKGVRHGYDWSSAREPLASLFYDRRHRVTREAHAVQRNRRLTGLALAYELPEELRYGLVKPALNDCLALPQGPYVVLLHATSRADKCWPEASWVALGQRLAAAGRQLVLPWGQDAERVRSERLASAIGPAAMVPPALTMNDAMAVIAHAHAVVGVDTGLAHLAVAFDVPAIGLYVATSPARTGLFGRRSINLGGPASPPAVDEVWDTLQEVVDRVADTHAQTDATRHNNA